MKTLERITLLLLLSVGGLVLAADYYDLPWLSSMAIIAFGLIACLGGVRILVRGEAFEGKTAINPRYVRRYTGVSARLIAVVLFLAGPVVMVLGFMDLSSPGRASSFLTELGDSPQGWAIILGLAGLMVTAMGIVRVLSGSGTSPGVYYRYVEFSIKVGGAFSILIGLAMLSLAAVGFLAPDLLKELFEEALAQATRLVEAWALNQ